MAALEAEVRTVKAARDALAEDAKAAAALIRAKDKALDAAAARVEEARLVAMENKARRWRRARGSKLGGSWTPGQIVRACAACRDGGRSAAPANAGGQPVLSQALCRPLRCRC